MKFIILTLGFYLFAFSSASGQEFEEKTEIKMATISIDFGFPLGPFKTTLGSEVRNGYSISYFKQVDTTRYAFVGAEFSLLNLGSLSNTVNNGGFDSFSDQTSSDVLSLMISYRHFSPFYWKILEPFVQVGIGPQFFYTATSTAFLDGSNQTDFRFEETSFSFGYEIGIGCMGHLYRGFNFFVSVLYRGGTPASYLSPDPNGLVSLYPIDSFTLEKEIPVYFKTQLGITYSF